MKKIISAITMCLIASSAFASAQVINSSSYREYVYINDGSFGKTDYNNEKNDGYVSGRFDFSFLNFKNKYSSDYNGADQRFNSDNYSFEPVLGFDFAVGYYFGPQWRGDIEFGYIGHFMDSDTGFKYELSIPYLMVNGYYDLLNGLYVGAGVGAAIPTMRFDLNGMENGNNRVGNNVGFIGGLNLGYAHRLNDNILLDLRYRLAGITGVKHTRDFVASDSNTYYLTVDTGFIIDNSVSIGIRYEF